MKKGKDNTTAKPGFNKKQGKLASEYLPSNIKNIPREQTVLKAPEVINREFTPFIEPCQISEEWPGDEEAKNFDFGIQNLSGKFVDPFNWEIKLPYSIKSETMSEVKWLRPGDYVREYYLEKEIKIKLPSSNHIQIRKKINEYYSKQTSLLKKNLNLKANDEDKKQSLRRVSFKRSMTSQNLTSKDEYDEIGQLEIVKDFQRIYETVFDFKIVKMTERDENEDEFVKRKLEHEAKLKDAKLNSETKSTTTVNANANANANAKTDKKIANKTNTNTSQNEHAFINSPIKLKEYLPSDLSMSERYPKYSKWIASIFQFIKDMNIKDVNTNETIFGKVYPQRDGVPIYNPHGRYWVKLFFMGKYRKVEVDDTMPCGKYDEFLIPKCEMLEELWPAIISKALFKLFTYKFRNSNEIYEEIGDPSVLYALTGYIGERISIDLKSMENLGYISSTDLVTEFTENNSKSNSNSPNAKRKLDTSCVDIISNILSDDCYQYSQKYLIGFNSSVPIDDEKFGFNNNNSHNTHNEERILEQYNELERKRNVLKKRSSVIDIRMSENKIHKGIDTKALKILKQRASVLINPRVPVDNYTASSFKKQESIFSWASIENIEKKERINEEIGNMLLKPIKYASAALCLSPVKEQYSRFLSKEIAATKSSTKLIQIDLQSPHHKSEMNVFTSALLESGNSNKNRPSDINLKQISLNERINDLIYLDFAYSVVEVFNSIEFNMKRLRPVDFSDLKKKIQDAKVSYKQLSKEAKKTYIQNLKDLKIKQKDEKMRRLEDLKKPGRQFYFVKIKNDCIDRRTNPLDFPIKFNDAEIEMAKKCMLNGWNYPPPDFFDDTYEVDGLNTSSLSDNHSFKHSNTKSGLHISSWTKDFYTSQILNNQIELYEGGKQPLIRQKGQWVDMKEFTTMFKYFLVLHNPKFYPFQISIDNNWVNSKHDLYQPLNDYQVFYFTPNNQRNSNSHFSSNNIQDPRKSCFLITFEPNTNRNIGKEVTKFSDVNYYLNFELYDVSGNLIDTANSLELNRLFSVAQYEDLEPLFEYFLVIKGAIVPFGYYMRILSDHVIEHMSYESYLKRFLNYAGFTFNFSYPSLEENKFYLIGRLKCKLPDKITQEAKLIFSANKFEDNYFKQFIEIYAIQANNEKKRVYFNKEFTLSNLCDLDNEEELTFIICTRAPFSVHESSIEIEIISDEQGLKIEVIENIDPFEISDSIVSNKHGFVCIECIYVPLDTLVYASLEFSLKRMHEGIRDHVRMKLEVIKGDKLIYSEDFYNTLLIHNLVLDNTIGANTVRYEDNKEGKEGKDTIKEGKDTIKESKDTIKTKSLKTGFVNIVSTTSDHNSPFYLYCYLDLSESKPMQSFEEEGVNWKLRVFASDSMVIIKNTQKEDNEKALKEGWEINEPGRKENARKARVKFQNEITKAQGGKLTTEEESLLIETRIRKKNGKLPVSVITPDICKMPAGKNTNATAKDNKPNAASSINNNNKGKSNHNLTNPEIDNDAQYKLNFDKELPKADHHHSVFLKNFLNYAYQSRVVTKIKDKGEMDDEEECNNAAPLCRTEEEIINMKEEIVSKADRIQMEILKEIDKKLNDKDKMSENLTKEYIHISKRRIDRREKYMNDLITERNLLKENTNKNNV